MGRVRLLGALVVLLALLAFVSGNGKVLLPALPLVAYLGAGVLSRPRRVRLVAERTLGVPRTAAQAEVDVQVGVLNQGDRIEELLLVDEIPASLSCTGGSTRSFVSLAPGEKVEWSYTVSGKRGEHRWQRVLAETWGHCELLGGRAELESESALLVLPVAERLPPLRIRPRQTRGFSGPIPARAAGPGVSFFGVRDYRMGDPLRWINWRMSSRTEGGLFANEFEQEKVADVGVVLDTRARSYPEHPHDGLFEAAVLAAVSLADLFLSEGNRVALLVYGHSWERVHPGYGKVQRERIRLQLARARTGTNYALQSLAYLPTRMFPPRSQIIMVSPLLPEDREVLVAIRSMGYSLLLVSPDPLDDEVRRRAAAPGGRAQEDFSSALRFAGLERAVAFAALRRAGIVVMDWQCGPVPGASLRSCIARHYAVHLGEELAR
jgi:uncharacterized protein (DUF58 family)